MHRWTRVTLNRRTARIGAACAAIATATAGAQTGYVPPVPVPGSAPAIPWSSPAAALAPAPGTAQPSWWTASIGVVETLTNNVNLDASSVARSALVTEITPVFGVNYVGPRASVVGNVQLPVAIYLPSSAASDRLYPLVNLLGDLTLVNNFLFLEGLVNVSEQFYSPFGAQPSGVSNPTNNRYRSTVYRITPFIKGQTSAGTNYELRNDNAWTNLSGAPISTSNARYTTLYGSASNTTTILGWRVSGDYSDVHFDNQQPSTITQLYRASGIYTATPALQLSASGGYEENQFSLTSSSDAIYGVGFLWQPSQLTNVQGDWEHRYFGSSYRLSFDHVTPLSEWRLHVLRNVTTYPQQIATLPAGINVSAFLNALFLPVVSDPAQRQQIIDQLIADRGLPATLSGPVNLYANQTLLQQSATGTVGLIGARNTVFLTAFYVKSQPITAGGTPLPPLFSFGNDNTQTGGSFVWSHQLMPRLTFVTSLDANETVSNNQTPEVRTRQGTVSVGLSMPITANTSAFAGGRYRWLTSNVTQDYTETAGFVGLTYTFR